MTQLLCGARKKNDGKTAIGKKKYLFLPQLTVTVRILTTLPRKLFVKKLTVYLRINFTNTMETLLYIYSVQVHATFVLGLFSTQNFRLLSFSIPSFCYPFAICSGFSTLVIVGDFSTQYKSTVNKHILNFCRKRMKIISAGMPKTGTKSLTAALRQAQSPESCTQVVKRQLYSCSQRVPNSCPQVDTKPLTAVLRYAQSPRQLHSDSHKVPESCTQVVRESLRAALMQSESPRPPPSDRHQQLSSGCHKVPENCTRAVPNSCPQVDIKSMTAAFMQAQCR